MANGRQNFRNNTVVAFLCYSQLRIVKHLEVTPFFSRNYFCKSGKGVTSVNQTSVNFCYQPTVDLRNF
jgi:hypothetical protein